MVYLGCVGSKFCLDYGFIYDIWMFRLMKTLLFVTGNVNKVQEVRTILGDRFTVMILSQTYFFVIRL